MQSIQLMQLAPGDWLIAIAAAFGFGLVLGYIVRAFISWRRRRRAGWAQPGRKEYGVADAYLRLKPPAASAPSIFPDLESGATMTPRADTRHGALSREETGRG